jgi:DNA adenine methylase
MRYFGGKARIAKQLSDFINQRLKPNQVFVDAFCGSCNVVSKVQAPVRIANDLHKELITLHKAVQQGWIPPDSISEEEYQLAKAQDDYLKAFVGFGCSFAGKYFGGYARGNEARNYCSNAKHSLLKKHKALKDVQFYSGSYLDLVIPYNSLVYCDIPYKNTTGYSVGDFNHEIFYTWCKNLKDQGCDVLVSEYKSNVPKDWNIVLEINARKDIRNKEGIQESTVEVLMTP